MPKNKNNLRTTLSLESLSFKQNKGQSNEIRVQRPTNPEIPQICPKNKNRIRTIQCEEKFDLQ